MAQWVGQCGISRSPLINALQRHVLERGTLHADETPVRMLKPGNGKTRKAP